MFSLQLSIRSIIVNVTPFEPEWEGCVTLETSNTPLPASIFANKGFAEVSFFEVDDERDVSYTDKKGKYQIQESIVLPKRWSICLMPVA